MDKNELIIQIEQAFDDAVYPGDDKLTRNTRPEYIKLAFELRNKDWTMLANGDFLPSEQFALNYLEPEGFRYYLPGFMLAVLKKHSVPEATLESVEFDLSPPLARQAEIDRWVTDFHITPMEYFLERVSGFSPDQKKTIRDYLEYSFANHWTVISEETQQKNQHTLRFWDTFEG